MTRSVGLRDLGRTRYEPVFEAMKAFTEARDDTTPDELWLTEHEPVFTQGQAGKAEHLLTPGDIPVVRSDRGGQVTYHGPGQIVGYLMFDIRRMGCSVRSLVRGIEQAVVDTLAGYGVAGAPMEGAPGVYVDGAKIASLGLRVRRGCSYHGLALNVDMDLEPFSRINPCGMTGMPVTQLADRANIASIAEVRSTLVTCLAEAYGLRLSDAGEKGSLLKGVSSLPDQDAG